MNTICLLFDYRVNAYETIYYDCKQKQNIERIHEYE